MRTPTVILVALTLLTLALPTVAAAPAEPQCLQVYPWSELCQGDVGGFLCAMGVCPAPASGPECLQVYPWSELCGGDVGGFLDGMGVGLPCDVKDCVQVDCIQAHPWSDLCGGDVRGFACYYVHCDEIIAA